MTSTTAIAVVASGAVVASLPAAAPAMSAQGKVGSIGGLVATAPVESDLTSTVVQELTSATATTTLLPSGEYELNAATSRINYRDESGDWAPIDTALVEPTADSNSREIPATDYAAENAAAEFTASIPADAEATPARIAVDDVAGLGDGEAWVQISMAGMGGAPVVEGDTATFEEMAPMSPPMRCSCSRRPPG